jgi:hypothetical protein
MKMEAIGYWDALAYASLFLVILALAYLLLGRRKTRVAPEFLSGESYEYKTPAHNFFYGFERSLSRLFSINERFHSGIINEYVAWLLVFGAIATLLFIAMFAWGAHVI